MKYRVIKEYAGIEVGSEVKLADSSVKYMIESGYVEPIMEPIEPIIPNLTVTIEGSNLASALDRAAENKAIEPKYKRNATKAR